MSRNLSGREVGKGFEAEGTAGRMKEWRCDRPAQGTRRGETGTWNLRSQKWQVASETGRDN